MAAEDAAPQRKRAPRREPAKEREKGPTVVGMGDHMPRFIALSFEERMAG